MNQINLECDSKLCPNTDLLPSSSIRDGLGPSLAQVFFQYIHDDTKKLLDVITLPKTSKTCFSISSENDSRDTALVPPSDYQVIKALVHENILEIGDDILERVKKEVKNELKEIIEKQSRQKFYMYQAKKRLEAEENTQRLHTRYKDYVKSVQKKLQEQIEIEWANLATEHAKNLQKAVVQKRMDVEREMMQKMRIEISYVVRTLYRDFEESFRAQRETMISDFNRIIREKHVQLKKNMEEFERRLSKELYIQRHQLEMQNATDIIYVLCLERFRSDREKHNIHTYFEVYEFSKLFTLVVDKLEFIKDYTFKQKQIEQFYELIVRLKDILIVMRKEIVDCHTEKKLLEEKLYQITKQFQKFIEFVLHAAPGQAEYLLPLELQRLITVDKNKEEAI